jgi:phage terminase small subunit
VGRTVKQDKNLATGVPLKPENLSPRASAEWDRLSSELSKANIQVTPAHRSSLSMAATISADIASAWAAIEKDGAYIAGKQGIVAHPATKRLDALRRDYIKILTVLGLRTAVPQEPKKSTMSASELLDQ